MLAFRKNFLQRCGILLRGGRGRGVCTEYACCWYCRTGCLGGGFGFESVAIGFFQGGGRVGGRSRRCG